MEQEIKITISKRHLTYYSMCFIVIVATFMSGYYWGRSSSTAHSTKDSKTPLTLNIEHSDVTVARPNNIELPTPPIGEAPSDPSWSRKLAKPTNPTTDPMYDSGKVETYRYYSRGSEDVDDESDAALNPPAGEDAAESEDAFVASKNGKKYYPVSCKSADRIKPENRVYFSSVEEAELEGLTRTSTCK